MMDAPDVAGHDTPQLPFDAHSLRAWRKRRRLKRPAAASLLGVSLRTLEGIEDGRYPGSPLLPVLERLTAALDREGVD